MAKMSFFKTWAKVMFDPMEFYQKLPDKIKYKEPSVYYIKLQVIAYALLSLFFAMMLGMFFQAMFGYVSSIVLFSLVIFVLPIMVLLSWGLLFVKAGVLHLFVILFNGKAGYAETFKVMAYAETPMLFQAIPLLGFAALVYSMILQVIGIHKRHKLDLGASIAIVLLPIAIVMLLFFLLFIVSMVV